MMNGLLIGAKDQRRSGFVTLDANPASGADIIATLPPLPQEVTSRRWDQIELIHCIEHFYLWDAETLLREIRGVLAHDGVLVLEQPNIEYCARVLLGLTLPPNRVNPGQYDMWGFYGDPGHKDPLMGHHWGYTPATLTALLRDCGFSRIEQCPARYHAPVRDFRLEARP